MVSVISFDRAVAEAAVQLVFEYEGWGSEHVEEFFNCGDMPCAADEFEDACHAAERFKSQGLGYDAVVAKLSEGPTSKEIQVSQLNFSNAKRSAKRMSLGISNVVGNGGVTYDFVVTGDRKKVEKFVKFYQY